jgi:hypothetical protein
MRKQIQVNSEGGGSGIKKCKRGYSDAYSGVWCLKPQGQFCVGALGRNLPLVAEKKLSHLLYFFKEIF